ncbi:hypothetical protein [Arthrobacter sp. KNU40]|uniref:hypothetical protein n=1 Tax=Arthrobacter sp. KNU40 TaxID=3447965 RepID=UPI003F602F57
MSSMLKKVWELMLVIVLLVVGLTIASEAIKPYLPLLGIGIVLVILAGSIWAVIRMLNGRGIKG